MARSQKTPGRCTPNQERLTLTERATRERKRRTPHRVTATTRRRQRRNAKHEGEEEAKEEEVRGIKVRRSGGVWGGGGWAPRRISEPSPSRPALSLIYERSPRIRANICPARSTNGRVRMREEKKRRKGLQGRGGETGRGRRERERESIIHSFSKSVPFTWNSFSVLVNEELHFPSPLRSVTLLYRVSQFLLRYHYLSGEGEKKRVVNVDVLPKGVADTLTLSFQSNNYHVQRYYKFVVFRGVRQYFRNILARESDIQSQTFENGITIS